MELRGYAKMIHEAVPSAPIDALGDIEDIMRHDIFHSTLDWVPPRQFNNGARNAYTILKAIGPYPKHGGN